MFKDLLGCLEEDIKQLEELITQLEEVKKSLISEEEANKPPKILKTELPEEEFGKFIEERSKEGRARIPGTWEDEKDLFEIIYKLGTEIKKRLSDIPGVYLLSSSQGTWLPDKEVDEEGKVKNGKLSWFLKLGSVRTSSVSTVEIEGVIENYELKKIQSFKTVRGNVLELNKENILNQF